jgi:hypothetical protein
MKLHKGIFAAPAVIMACICMPVRAADHDAYNDSDLQNWAANASSGDVVHVHNGTFSPFSPQASGVTFVADSATYIDGGGINNGQDGIAINAPAHDITVRWFKVQNCKRGIVCNNATNVVIDGIYTWHTFESGIAAWGSPSEPCENITVNANTVDYACDGGWNECITFSGVRDSVITYNTVKNAGSSVNGGEGIDIKDTAYNIEVNNNTIVNLKRVPIQLDGGWGDGLSYINVYNNKIEMNGDNSGITLETEGRAGYQHIVIFNNCIKDCYYSILVWDPHSDWGGESPDFRYIPADGFSARWTGQVQPLYSETYTFYTTSDDGVRLWVNGVQVINNWTDHAATENSGTITLTGGQKYNIVMEYYENAGDAVAKLAWSSPSQGKEIIPNSQLFQPGGSGNGLQGDYFANQTLSGSAALTRVDATLEFDWNRRMRDDVWIQQNTIYNCSVEPKQDDWNATNVHWDNTLWVNTWAGYPQQYHVPPGSPAPRNNAAVTESQAAFYSTDVWNGQFLRPGPNCPGNGQGCAVGNQVSYDFGGNSRPSTPDCGAWQHY